MGSAKTLFLMILLALAIGAVVMVLSPRYRRPYNLVTNRNFYSIMMER